MRDIARLLLNYKSSIDSFLVKSIPTLDIFVSTPGS
jgi:hypothetical protein